MLPATPVHPEGPRYAAPVVYLGGLWVSPDGWRRAATYLAHRGWEGTILDPRGVRGGVAARGAAIATHLRALAAPPIVIGQDAGALAALAAAATIPVRAIVLVSPLVPGAAGTHAVAWSSRLVWALVRRRPLGPPEGPARAAFFDGLAPTAEATAQPEDPRFLAALARRATIPRPLGSPPILVLRGAADPLVSHDDVARLAADLGAELDEIPGRAHWLVAPPAWQECVHRVHRWLVQRLGETILELYAEAMAERDTGDDEP